MQHMAHFLCHYYTTIRPLYFDFIDFPALLYDKIRDLSLGLCLQSVLTSMSDVSILLRIYVWRACLDEALTDKGTFLLSVVET